MSAAAVGLRGWWGDPRALGFAARALSLAAAALVLAAAARAAADYVFRPRIIRIEAVGDIGLSAAARARAADIARDFAAAAAQNGGVPDLDSLRRDLSTIAGVGDAEARLSPPGKIAVRLRLRAPLARWSDGAMVDADGARYEGDAPGWLPIFNGPAEQAPEMAALYRDAREILRPRGLEIAQLEIRRGGWRIFLRGGETLILGREKMLPRLAEFARIRPALGDRLVGVRRFDLRYPRGFAVRGRAANLRKESE